MELTAFITKWLGVKGGADRSNYALFIHHMCGALDLPVHHVA